MRILHISDLHIGHHSGDGSLLSIRSYRRYLRKLFDSIPTSSDHPAIDLLFISGDFIDKGDSSSWQHATLVVDYLITLLRIERKQVIICPGNHDYKWTEKTHKRTRQSQILFDAFFESICGVSITESITKPPVYTWETEFGQPGVMIVSIDCLHGAKSYNDQVDIDIDSIDLVIEMAREREVRLLLVCAHNLPAAEPSDQGGTADPNYSAKFLKNGPYFITRLQELQAQQGLCTIWFSGEVHKEVIFPIIPGSMLAVTTGRLGGIYSSGKAPSATLLELDGKCAITRICWITKEHEEALTEGQWKSFSSGLFEFEAAARNRLSNEFNLFNSINPFAKEVIEISISQNKLLIPGRFHSSRNSRAALLWLKTEELLGAQDAPRGAIVGGFSRVIHDIIENTNEHTASLDDLALVGLGIYGSLLAGMIGPEHGIKVVALPVESQRRKNELEQVLKGPMVEVLIRCKTLIFLTDVVRSGNSAKAAIDQVIIYFDEGEMKRPDFHLLSIISGKEGEEMKANVNGFSSRWSFINSLNLLLLEQSELPSTDLFPETPFL